MLVAAKSKTGVVSIHGSACPGLVQQQVLHDNVNSVHKLQTTELENKLALLDASLVQGAACSIQQLVVQCKGDSEHNTVDSNSVQKLVVQGANSVNELQTAELENRLEPEDWRVPLVYYLEDPSQIRDEIIRPQAFTCSLSTAELYLSTIDGFLLKFLESDQNILDKGEVMKPYVGHNQLVRCDGY